MKKLLAVSAAMMMMCISFTSCGGRDKDSSSEEIRDSSVSDTTDYRDSDKRDETNSDNNDRHNSVMDETGSNNAAGDYVSDVIDGVESAGEDIVHGVGDAAGDIADGLTGREDNTSGTHENTTGR
ncbi:MAG: hypothetical protein IJX77_08005 [Ruminococcus sp.]|nr:hypothetical protein [Ruminococcus sp.]